MAHIWIFSLPAYTVGLDVLILFISDLEYDDVDTTPGVGQ